MAAILSPGRWNGLKTASTDSHIFTIVAFDQRGSYEKMLPAGWTYDQAVQIKREVVSALSAGATAVLLDAQYGLPSALHMSRSSGFLMALEESGYTGDSTYRRVAFDDDWTVSKIKQVGATAVKLLVYYHPDAGELADEIEGVASAVADECHRHDLPLFLEPVSYSLDKDVSKSSEAFAATRPEVVRKTAERLCRTGADVLKMEFPVDADFNQNEDEWRAACEAVSAASAVPWVLLSAGVDFATFERQTRIACAAGASGFLAGRAIWKECIALSAEDRAQFLKTTAQERLQTLSDIAAELGRPWTDFYEPMPIPAEWYRSYP